MVACWILVYIDSLLIRLQQYNKILHSSVQTVNTFFFSINLLTRFNNCNKVYEAVRRRTVMMGNGRWNDETSVTV